MSSRRDYVSHRTNDDRVLMVSTIIACVVTFFTIAFDIYQQYFYREPSCTLGYVQHHEREIMR